MEREPKSAGRESPLEYRIKASESNSTRSKRYWGSTAAILGGAMATTLLATACREQAPSALAPTPTELMPSPTSNVAMYYFEEEDTNGDKIISILDLKEQRQKAGRECLECMNPDFDRTISQNDADIIRAHIEAGETGPRWDLNKDVQANQADVQKVVANIGKRVPSEGQFPADQVEAGWWANQVVVEFRKGTEVESNLKKRLVKSQNQEDLKELKSEVLQALGRDTGWQVENFLNLPDRGLTVILAVPETVLANATLGEIASMINLNPNVQSVGRVDLSRFNTPKSFN